MVNVVGTFKESNELMDHELSHKQKNKEEYNCVKCEKVYCDMRKLRRHDWRSHRSIECTICGEMLDNRQDIGTHRQNVHKMHRKIPCRYFPDCFDDDECLFDHKSSSDEVNSLPICPNGSDCSDQTCTFSEKSHKSLKADLCRFQAKCNRSGCLFKHTVTSVTRKTFLGGSPLNQRRV